MTAARKGKPTQLDDRAKARLRAAMHEAGRFIVANHFGVAQAASVYPVGNGDQFIGKTIYSPTSPANEAVIGWAGPLAEMRLGKSPEQWQDDCNAVWEMFAANQLTKTDSDLINRHAEKKKSFAQAVKILSGQLDEITRTAIDIFRCGTSINFPSEL